ncbi:MAG: radical SAM protein [bacterium]
MGNISDSTPHNPHSAIPQGRQLILEIGSQCNNRCYFCRAIGYSYPADDDSLLRSVERAAEEGIAELVITGHEPTLLPSLSHIVHTAYQKGFHRIRCETNARMLAYANFTRSLTAAGLTEAAVLVPAHTPELYEQITASTDGFSQCEAGMRNLTALKSPALQVSAVIPVCQLNLFALTDIVQYVNSIGINRCQLTVISDEFTSEIEYRSSVDDAVKTAEALGMFVEIREGGKLTAVLGAAERKKEALKSLFDISYCFIGNKKWLLGGTLMLDYHCNQRCPFCTVNNKLPAPPPGKVMKYIKYSSKKNYPRLVFTGGEPTLHPSLPNFIAAANHGGIPEIWLFTNAVRLADRNYADILAASGLNLALVSLHAHTPELSDLITGTPGAFIKTIQGIHNLLDLGVGVTLSFVINAKNYEYLPEYVNFVYDCFGSIPVNFSFVTPIFERTVAEGYMPCYSDAVPFLMAALRGCVEKGIPVHGLEPHWGIPPCMLTDISDYYGHLHPIRGSGIPREFIKKQTCAQCRYDPACHGVRRLYAATYGLDEIKPVISDQL